MWEFNILFENIDISLTSVHKSIRIVIVYRLRPSSSSDFTPTQFFMYEFFTIVEQCLRIPGGLLMVGSLNFCIDTCDSKQATKSLEYLDVPE